MKEFFAPSTYWNTHPHEPFKMFSAGHISVLILLVAAIALLAVFRKRFRHKRIKIFLIAMFFIWTTLEIFKIVQFIASSGDLHQALREVLPLYMCSLYLYSLPLAIFCKGKLKEIGEYTLVTLCLLSGTLTAFNCPVLQSYPFWSFNGLHSVLYHAFMSATGVLLLVSGYVKPDLKKFYYSLIPIVILSVPAIIMNNVVYTDYMLMRFAWGTPVLDDIAAAIGQIPQIILMFIIYTLIALIMTTLGRLIPPIKQPPAANINKDE